VKRSLDLKSTLIFVLAGVLVIVGAFAKSASIRAIVTPS
jgi:hypothetical protein